MLLLKLLLLVALFFASTIAFDCDNENGCVQRIAMYSQKGRSHPKLLKKLWKNSLKSAILQRNKVITDDAINVIVRRSHNAIHCTNITIGTPPQNFTVYLDLSLNSFWLPSVDCESEQCVRLRRYNASASTTYQKDGTQSDVDDNLGYLSRDITCIASVCAENQTFTEVTDMSVLYKYAPHDGLLGIGQYLQNTPFRPFFHSLMDQKKIRPFFSLWINGTKDFIQKDVISGELTLGGMNADRFTGPVTWIPALERDAWSFNLGMIKVNGSSVGSLNQRIADLCNNLPVIMGPAREIKAIHDRMEQFLSYNLGAFTIYYISNCTEETIATLPDISFVIGDKEFTLSPKDYVEILPENGTCESRLLSLKRKYVVWTFGTPFMARYYTMVNVEKKMIGLAASVY